MGVWGVPVLTLFLCLSLSICQTDLINKQERNVVSTKVPDTGKDRQVNGTEEECGEETHYKFEHKLKVALTPLQSVTQPRLTGD